MLNCTNRVPVYLQFLKKNHFFVIFRVNPPPEDEERIRWYNVLPRNRLVIKAIRKKGCFTSSYWTVFFRRLFCKSEHALHDIAFLCLNLSSMSFRSPVICIPLEFYAANNIHLFCLSMRKVSAWVRFLHLKTTTFDMDVVYTKLWFVQSLHKYGVVSCAKWYFTETISLQTLLECDICHRLRTVNYNSEIKSWQTSYNTIV